MTLSVLWGCVIVMILREPDMKFSLGIDIIILLLMAGIPYLIGYGIHRLGKSLGQPVSDAPLPQHYAPGEPVWSDTVEVPQKRPHQPPAQPSRFTPARKPVQEVEVDLEPEPTPPPVLANPVPRAEPPPPKPRAGTPDPTAMGVDELFDPEKE